MTDLPMPITDLGKTLNLKKMELAQIVGCSQSTLSRWTLDSSRIEEENRDILLLLIAVAKKPPKTRGALVERLRNALKNRGRLGALYVLLLDKFRGDRL